MLLKTSPPHAFRTCGSRNTHAAILESRTLSDLVARLVSKALYLFLEFQFFLFHTSKRCVIGTWPR